MKAPALLFPSLLAAILLIDVANAQRLTVASIDSTEFPTIKASVYAIDAAGAPIPGLSAADFTVNENGVPRRVTAFDCPPPPPRGAISSVLTVDVSGSMSSGPANGSAANIELARAAARAWIEALPVGSECALSSFDDASLVNQDFTNDRALLEQAIARLAPNGGTNYNAGLTASPAGGITIAANGANRRVVVFLTDGRGDGNEAAIVEAAQRARVTVFCVTLGMPAPQELRNIAQRTGGECYENVTSVAEARGIYHAILYRALGGEPCRIEWQSEPSCSVERTAGIALPSRSLTATLSYTAPKSSVPTVVLSPGALAFGVVAPGTSKELQITLTAANRTINVQRIEPVGTTGRSAAGTFTLSPAPGAFTLAPGERRTFTVRYAASDTNYAFVRWTIVGDACFAPSITASAGSGASAAPTIRVVTPNGGESFRAGEIATIAWDGVLPADTVRLDYSTNGGGTWRTIAERTTGGSYRWKVPATPSNRCLARAAQLGPTRAQEAEAITLSGHQDYVMATNFSSDGAHAVSASWDGTAKIWNARTGTLERTLVVSSASGSGRPRRVYYAEFSPDGRRVLTASDGNEIILWDAATGRQTRKLTGMLFGKPDVEGARLDGDVTPDPVFSSDGARVLVRNERTPTVYDAASGRAIPLTGHTNWVDAATFSPDGRRVVTASRDSTARVWDAATGRELRRFTGHGNEVGAVAFSPDGRMIASSGDDDHVRIWDAASGEQIHAFEIKERHRGSYLRVQFSPDGGQLLVWAGVDISPRLYDVATGAMVRELFEEPGGGARTSVGFMAFSPEGLRVASRAATVDLFDAGTGTKLSEFPWDMQMSYLAFSPDGSRIAAAMNRNVRLWSARTPTVQEDVSDSLWTIVDSRPASVDVDFGRRTVRTKNDTVVTAYVRNLGSAPLRVDAITIGGKHAKEFTLVSGIPPFEVPPGGSRNVEFRFTPAGAGERTASAAVDAGGRVLQQRLRGEGAWEDLRMETSAVDFGAVPVGQARDTVTVMLKNVGRTPIEITRARIAGPDTAQFTIVDAGAFSLAGGATREVKIRFAPTRPGRTSARLVFTRAGGAPSTASIYGSGEADEPLANYTDPTTFRSIAVPNAVVPPKGSVVLGVYDVAGVMAAWTPIENVMVLGGGGIPFPDDWGGVNGTMYGAWSLGVKANVLNGERLDVAAGYQFARSIYDREETDSLESAIVAHTPYAAVSYGDDDSRISLTAGFAFKTHTTIEAGEFSKDAVVVGLGGDYRIGRRWKLAAEVLAMQTLGFMPVAVTARFFGESYAFDAGLGYLGIGTGDGDPPSLKIAPVLSFVKVW